MSGDSKEPAEVPVAASAASYSWRLSGILGNAYLGTSYMRWRRCNRNHCIDRDVRPGQRCDSEQ